MSDYTPKVLKKDRDGNKYDYSRKIRDCQDMLNKRKRKFEIVEKKITGFDERRARLVKLIEGNERWLEENGEPSKDSSHETIKEQIVEKWEGMQKEHW